MQLQFTAMRCYTRDPAGGANSAPSELLAGLWGDERKGKGKGEGGRKGKDKEVKGERGGKEKGTKGREGEGRGRKEEKGKGGILCSCDFSYRKTADTEWLCAVCRVKAMRRADAVVVSTVSHVIRAVKTATRQPQGGGGQASNQQRACRQTVHNLFLANDRCLRDYDLVVVHC